MKRWWLVNEYLSETVVKISFTEEEKKLARWVIFESPAWSTEQINMAARGMVNGICFTDPWPTVLKSWLEFSRDEGDFGDNQRAMMRMIEEGDVAGLRSMSLPFTSGGKDDVLFYCR